ncbi:MAG: hypothetical protein WD335_02225 [Candidatus Paceibacterota bacterium]
MNVKDDKFIFTREHRRLTYLGGLAITPLFLTAIGIIVLQFTSLAAVTSFLEFIISASYPVQIILWLVLPLVSLLLSWRGLQHGTRRHLRKWNTVFFWLAVTLLGGIGILVAIRLI